MHTSQAVTDPRSPAITPGVPRLPVLKALTSVRFFAALHVALYHTVRPFTLWGPLAGFMSVGYSGVAFFFFLSGFILTYAHAAEYERGKGDAKKFWVARFARIYPVYLVVMLVSGVLGIDLVRKAAIHAVAFVADLLMLQSWSVRMVNFFHGGSWTLSCEAFFYLVFPFVLLRVRPGSRAKALGWFLLFYLLAMVAPIVCLLRYPVAASAEDYLSPGSLFVFEVRRYPYLALPEFLAGISLGWFFLKFKPSQRSAARMAPAGAVLLLLALFFGDRLPFIALHNGLLIPLYGLLLLGLSQSNWLERLLSGKFLILLGEASFALYLVHVTITTLAEIWFGYDHSKTEAAGVLTVSIAISILMHLYIERPCRRAILAWWSRRHPAEMRTV